MSDSTLATNEDICRFKLYIDIAKYAISIVIALSAVCGALIKINPSNDISAILVCLYISCFISDLIFFAKCHYG
jgi:hypothetical protein